MTSISIPEPRMPTLEEHRAASQSWLRGIKPCLYEHWPDELKSLSFRTEVIHLTAEDQAAVLDLFDWKKVESLGALEAKITAVLEGFPDGAFVKLSSRSPKDAFTDTFLCRTAQDVWNLFVQSERILDDLIEYKYLDDPCYLLIREWREIPQKDEWRCFILDGNIVGITQYHYTEDFSEAYGDISSVRTNIETFLTDVVLPILPIKTVVVDVWMKEDPQVIEINPYGLSDPCLLTYDEMQDGRGGFRVASTPDPTR